MSVEKDTTASGTPAAAQSAADTSPKADPNNNTDKSSSADKTDGATGKNNESSTDKQYKKKDATAIDFESINETFSEMIEWGCFNGERVIPPSLLQDTSARFSSTTAEGTITGITCDVSKVGMGCGFVLFRCGLENESSLSPTSDIFKYMGYIGSQYRQQLDRDTNAMTFKEFTEFKQKIHDAYAEYNANYDIDMSKWLGIVNDPNRRIKIRHPVYLVAVNFTNREYSTLSLADQVSFLPGEIGKVFRNAFCDYKVNVLNVAFMKEDQINRMTSDLKPLCQVLRALRTGKGMPDKLSVQHVKEFISLLSSLNVVDSDAEMEEINKIIQRPPNKEEGVNVRTGLMTLREYYEKRATARNKIETVERYARMHHMTAEEACKEIGYSQEEYTDAVNLFTD